MYLSLFSMNRQHRLAICSRTKSNQAVRVLNASAIDHGKLHGSNVFENVSLNTEPSSISMSYNTDDLASSLITTPTDSDCPTHVSIAIAIWKAIIWLIFTFPAQNLLTTLRGLISTAMSASAGMVTVKCHGAKVGISGGLAGANSTDGAFSDTTTAPAPVHGMCISIISIKCVCI